MGGGRTARLPLRFLLVATIALVVSGGGATAQPLRTAIYLEAEAIDSSAAVAFARTRAAGASLVRLQLTWSSVAPADRPPGFDPTNPSDPAYHWAAFDDEIKLAKADGLEPMVSIFVAPAWAERSAGGPAFAGGRDPSPTALAEFARAAARRYSGSFQGLPRIRYWLVWNEPNLSIYLAPQLKDNVPVSPRWYQQAVNGVADAIHSVHPDNVVVAGETAPFRDITPSVLKQRTDWGPLSFMRAFLCLSKSLRPTCATRVHFDAWSHHPYTSGGPTHHANYPDDVSLGDLPEMRRVLQAGVRTGHIVSARPVQFWVTEFSWDTKPPDPKGVPMALAKRWVAEALYRMWLNGVSVVTWFQLRDLPLTTSYLQSGLYFGGRPLASTKPKPTLEAFRFPLVAFKSGLRAVLVWGRTPGGVSARVLVERSFKGGWKALGTLRSDSNGIFRGRFRTTTTGSVRARLASTGERSLPFSLRPVPDHFYYPFGNPRLTKPPGK